MPNTYRVMGLVLNQRYSKGNAVAKANVTKHCWTKSYPCAHEILAIRDCKDQVNLPLQHFKLGTNPTMPPRRRQQAKLQAAATSDTQYTKHSFWSKDTGHIHSTPPQSNTGTPEVSRRKREATQVSHTYLDIPK